MPSQSHSTFPPPLPSPACLPLTKFSYATVSNEHIVPIPWIHLSSKTGLFALFETSPTQLEDGQLEDRPKLKVLRDPEVMEEIDLHLLSLEAHRSMKTNPDSLHDAQVPLVTIIVKVPHIAIKYPMTNGQIRRFQMRFASNEHYYDAMKILSRANVPTVEAGSFPPNRPQQPVQYPTPTNILPDDSASQIGGCNPVPQSFATNIHLGSELNLAPHSMLTQGATATATAHNMPPPMLRRPSNHSLGQLPTMKNSISRATGNQSNLSVTTGTTLVPPIGALSHPLEVNTGYRGRAPQPEVNNIVPAQREAHQYETDLHITTNLTDPSAGLLLPPRRELPFIKAKPATEIRSPHNAKTTTTGVADPIANSSHNGVTEPQDASGRGQDQAASVNKGKSKRVATKTGGKPPAAKKPRAPASRKKPPAKRAVKNKTPIPSVEDLLQRSEVGRWTRSRSLLATQNQSPRHSNSREVEELVGDTMSGNQAVQISPSRESNRQCAESAFRHLAATNLEIEKTPMEPDNAFPCTPADQIIQTHPPRPPTPTIGSVLPSKQIPKHKEQIQKGPPTLFASINGDVSTHKAPTMVYSPANMDARLGRDSQFANADASLEAWATLPPEIRNPDLRDFVCRSIMQPHFVDLCKALENVWETTLLEPRLRERDL